MIADVAGQSWLDRTSEIIAEYKAATDDTALATVHMEGTRASAGISALFENRGSELSQGMIDKLNQAVDVLAQINADSLDASYESPWSSASKGFGQDVGQELEAGLSKVKKTAKDLGDKFQLDLTMVAVAAVAVLLLAIIFNAKVEKALT